MSYRRIDPPAEGVVAPVHRRAASPTVDVWRQYRYFLRHHPGWYVGPLIAALGALALWAAVAGPSAQSFAYDLF